MRVKELAEWLRAKFEGDGEIEITGVAPLESAGPGDLSFINSRKAALQATRAGCLIVPADYTPGSPRALIRDASPRAAFARAIPRLRPSLGPSPGIHITAEVGQGTR